MPRKDARSRVAAELQAERESLTDWERIDVAPSRSARMVLSIRMTPQGIDDLQAHASRLGVSVSEVVRTAVQAYFERQGRVLTFADIANDWGTFQRGASYTRSEAKIEATIERAEPLAISA